MCSIVTIRGHRLAQDSSPAAQYLACFAFKVARRLITDPPEGTDAKPKPTKPTQRQLEGVMPAARGKSNRVPGKLLGLSPDTADKYLESAKRRYGVSSRTELVVRALHDGQLRFNDVIHDMRPGSN